MQRAIKGSSVIGICSALTTAVSASAQCDVYRIGVPDFDQQREALPGGGNCYSGPTAASNWFAFMANNGYPDVFSGPREWQAAANYGDVTTLIGWVGLAMGTPDGVDPDGGGPLPANPCTTSYSGFIDGVSGWLDSVHPGEFIACTVASNAADTISPRELSAQLAFGALVGVSYRGFAFAQPDAQLGLPSRWVMQSQGHVVSMTRMTDACSARARIWFRDSSGLSGDNASQSPFVTQFSDLAPVPGFYAADSTSVPVFRTMWLMSNVSNTNMVNATFAIAPVHALWAQPDSGEVVLGGMWDPQTLQIPVPASHSLAAASGVVSLRMSPRIGQAMVIYRDSADTMQVGRLELHDYATSTLVPLGEIINPGPFVFMRSGRLIGLEQGNRLIFADVSGASLVRSKMIALERAPVAIAADDAAGQAILLLAAAGELEPAVRRFDDVTLAAYPAESLPVGITVDLLSSMAFDARSSALYIANAASGATGALHRITRSESTGQLVAEQISNPLIVEPRAVQVTHRGTIVFESLGVCRTLKFNSTLGQWVADTDHPLSGQSIGPIFDLASSRSVVDSLDPDGEFDNLINVDSGPGIPDCIADFDGNGAALVTDIFAFLSQWFAADRVADVDLDGDTDVPDIFAFLSSWFAGC